MRASYCLLPPGQAPPPRDPAPFAAVVIVEADVTDEWRASVSEWLVQAGCRYMMAWGRDCSKWDDSVDEAVLERSGWGDVPEAAYLVTTWHDDETLNEVFWYARHAATVNDTLLPETLLLHVAKEERADELLRSFAGSD